MMAPEPEVIELARTESHQILCFVITDIAGRLKQPGEEPR
jgi:hypothetical protein